MYGYLSAYGRVKIQKQTRNQIWHFYGYKLMGGIAKFFSLVCA